VITTTTTTTTTTTATTTRDSNCKALQLEGCLMLPQSIVLGYNAPTYNSSISQGMFRQSMSISQCLVKLILRLRRNCYSRAYGQNAGRDILTISGYLP